jgi:hypothetical protein
LFEVFAAADVHQVAVTDDEVGGKHRGSDLATVGAVADEGLDEAGGRCRLQGLVPGYWESKERGR